MRRTFLAFIISLHVRYIAQESILNFQLLICIRLSLNLEKSDIVTTEHENMVSKLSATQESSSFLNEDAFILLLLANALCLFLTFSRRSFMKSSLCVSLLLYTSFLPLSYHWYRFQKAYGL